MMRGTIATWLVLAAFAIGALATAGQAAAQYPQVNGSLELGTADSNPNLGEDVAISVTVKDEDGEAAAGVECTFEIVSQPGTDAEVDAGPFTTDAEGSVSTTLDTGSTTGTIVVQADCGDLTAQVSMAAGQAAPPPGSLPDTGTGAAPGSVDWAFWSLVALGAVACLSALALASRRARA